MSMHILSLDDILKLDSISHFPPRRILDIHGELFDYCRSNTGDCSQELLKWKELLEESENKMKNNSLAYVYYFFYSHYWTIKGIHTAHHSSDWYNYCQERGIYCLRKSIASFEKMQPEDTYDEMIAQVLTNIGAELADMGRNVEAIKYFNWVLRIDPYFNMSIGNKGICLLELAQSVTLEDTKYNLLRAAKQSLEQVQDDHIVTDQNIINFMEALRVTDIHIESISPDTKEKYHVPRQLPEDMLQEEKNYRLWALKHNLFLNLLCEAELEDEAASDNLFLFRAKSRRKKDFQKYNGYFNHIIEKFTISRWFFYEGSSTNYHEKHFSENRITYTDLGEDSIENAGKQKIFASFMLCYSILDKLALFINEYFHLRIVERTDLNLRNLWYQDFPKNKELRKSIKKYMDNPHLKALYWLSKDVYYREQDEEILEPSARDWRKIRNHLTHEYIQVTKEETDNHLSDPNSYFITYTDLQSRCLSMLQLIRNAIIYLFLAVTHEELKIEEKSQKNTFFDSQFSVDSGIFTL